MKKLYIVKDSKSRVWPSPVVFDGDEFARRALATSVNRDKDTLLSLYPSDFDLWCVGEFDESKGVVLGSPAPIHVCNANDLKELKA